MSRNQFESILCLLREGFPDKSRMYETYGCKITKGRGHYVFKFLEGTNPTLSTDQIDKSAGKWSRVTYSFLALDTGGPMEKVLGDQCLSLNISPHNRKNFYKEGDFLYPQLDVIEAYKRTLRTWAKWIDSNIDPTKKLVFYRGFSSAQFRDGDWDFGGSCNGETQSVLKGNILDNYPLKMKIIEEVIREMQVPLLQLNVARLTILSEDGHLSIYGKPVANDGRKVSTKRQTVAIDSSLGFLMPGMS
ncbi:PC-Esterase [Dillenia turbinata]|uniref:PC-Esterase n=1 Tax=Dillenia turbinata TaxID=194707 RepID=A0AAN8Z3Z9_9MAGN